MKKILTNIRLAGAADPKDAAQFWEALEELTIAERAQLAWDLMRSIECEGRTNGLPYYDPRYEAADATSTTPDRKASLLHYPDGGMIQVDNGDGALYRDADAVIAADGNNIWPRDLSAEWPEIRAELCKEFPGSDEFLPSAPQIANPEFCAWLDTTSFAGIVKPGEQWDTETAWPNEDVMKAARKCFDLFMAGNKAEAEEWMHVAQGPFV